LSRANSGDDQLTLGDQLGDDLAGFRGAILLGEVSWHVTVETSLGHRFQE